MRTALVVVPTLNEVRTIAAVLESLSVDPPADVALRFIVADGGSTDGTREMVRALAAQRSDLRLLHNPDRRQGPGVNRAVLAHGGDADVLIRADAHAQYPPGFCASLLDTLERTGADAVVVPMDSHGEGCFQRAVAWVSDTPVGSGGAAHRGGRRSGFVDHGHHAAFRLDTFRRAGGYDASLRSNEDGEFDCRQRALGARIYLDATVRVAYHPRATPRSLAKQYFDYGWGRSCTLRRHPSSARLRQLAVPAHFAVTLGALLAAPWWPALLVWPASYLAVLAATSIGLAWRHRSACALLAGVAAAVMHAAWAAGFVAALRGSPQPRWRAPMAAPLGSALRTPLAAGTDR
ncbi:MAG TPA: glycosyltransferase family 2 protein [Burkholderiaceae bacterium]|nr:glycosyltransferase family 2 protein [Burkholderiaceae bacterium]